MWMVLEMGGWWPYSCWFIRRCFQSGFFSSSFFSVRLVRVHVVLPYSRIDISDKSDFHMIDNLSITVQWFFCEFFFQSGQWDREYTDYIPYPCKKREYLYGTKLYLILMFQFWRSFEYAWHLSCYYSQFHSNRSDSICWIHIHSSYRFV